MTRGQLAACTHCTVAACMLAFGILPSYAAEPGDRDRFLVVPYLWAINIEADLELGELAVPISLDFGDLLRDVEYGGLGYAQWNINDNFLFAEGIVVNFAADDFEPFFSQSVGVDFTYAEIGYGRHFEVRNVVLSPHIGLLRGDLDVVVSGLFDLRVAESWTGVAVGVMVNGPLSDKLSYTARAQVSGFSGELDEFATAMAAVNFHLNGDVALSLGYRMLRSNYRDNGLAMETDFDGAVAGVQLSW